MLKLSILAMHYPSLDASMKVHLNNMKSDISTFLYFLLLSDSSFHILHTVLYFWLLPASPFSILYLCVHTPKTRSLKHAQIDDISDNAEPTLCRVHQGRDDT